MDGGSVLTAPLAAVARVVRLGYDQVRHGDPGRMKHSSLRAALLAAHVMRLKGTNVNNLLPLSHPLSRSIQNSRLRLSGGVLTDEMMLILLNMSSHRGISVLQLTNLRTAVGSSLTMQPFILTVLCDHRSSLTSVCLTNCQVDDDCAIQLATLLSSVHFFPNLKVLDVSRNDITDHGALALTNAILCGGDYLDELDISRNQLSLQGMSMFVEAIQVFRNLRVLHLRDSELLISASLMNQFRVAVESNYVLHTLSVGCEIMDGTVAPKQSTAMGLDIVDDLLYYCWQEPAYTAASNRIRFFLRLNHIGVRDIVQSGGCTVDVDTLRDAIGTLTPNEQTEAWYRILSLKPDLVRWTL